MIPMTSRHNAIDLIRRIGINEFIAIAVDRPIRSYQDMRDTLFAQVVAHQSIVPIILLIPIHAFLKARMPFEDLAVLIRHRLEIDKDRGR